MDLTKFKIFVDFDGTITRQDVGDAIFREFGNTASTDKIITSLLCGEITARKCWELLFSSVNNIDKNKLDSFIDRIEIDETYHQFQEYCFNNNIESFVLSDGFDYYINRIFMKENLKQQIVFSNNLIINERNELIPSFPFFDINCQTSANCKRNHIINNSRDDDFTVYIGEGNFLNIWVRDKNDRKWQFTFGRVNHNQTWQQMTAQISVAPGWPNEIVDGKPAPTGGIAYPLRLDALVIDGVDAELPSSGVIYVDDLTAVSLPAGALQAANPVAAVPAPTAAPPPSAAPVNIFFQSDRTSINAGECYTLNWNVTEVNGVWLNDQGVPGQGNQQICPSQTLTFKLKVQKRDNTFEERVLTVQATGNPQPPAANPPPVSAPAPPDSGYGTLGVIAADTRRPPESNPDLNLSLLGYQPNGAAPTFKDYGPADDPLAPQLRGLFADRRQPSFTTAFSNNGWDWNSNTPTPPSPSQYEVAVIGVAVTPGEMLFMPGSGRSIGNDYSALVLYADGNQITLKYTPEDSIARGYTVFIEGISVNPQLMAVYQSSNGAGRGSLPALKTGQQIGTAQGGEIRIAVRDNATFMDPRSLQDWWR